MPESRDLISKEKQFEDELDEESLRPRYLPDYIGQEIVKDNLNVFIEAARQRGDALDHILLSGPRDWERPLSRTLSRMNLEGLRHLRACHRESRRLGCNLDQP